MRPQRIRLAGLALLVALAAPAGAEALQTPHAAPELAGRTYRLSIARGRPVIVYFKADGSALVWSPGRARGQETFWRVQRTPVMYKTKDGAMLVRTGHQVCLSPAPGGGRGLCGLWQRMLIGPGPGRAGDVFDLGSGEVPCRLCRGDQDIDALLGQIGR